VTGFCDAGCTDSSQCPATGFCDTERVSPSFGFCRNKEICDNGIDDTHDLAVDCEDIDCLQDATCINNINAECAAAGVLLDGVITHGDNSLIATNKNMGSECTGFGEGLEQIFTFDPQGRTGVLALTLVSATDLGLYIRSSC